MALRNTFSYYTNDKQLFNCSLIPTHWAAPEEYFPAAPSKEQLVTDSSTSPGTCHQVIPAGKTPKCDGVDASEDGADGCSKENTRIFSSVAPQY